MNQAYRLWLELLDWLGLHNDVKKINALRLKIENLEIAHAKLFVRNPLCEDCRKLREDIVYYKSQIVKLEERYPDWSSL